MHFLKDTMSPIEVNLLSESHSSIFLGCQEATVELGTLGRVGAPSTVGTISSLVVIRGRQSVSAVLASGNSGLGSSTHWLGGSWTVTHAL